MSDENAEEWKDLYVDFLNPDFISRGKKKYLSMGCIGIIILISLFLFIGLTDWMGLLGDWSFVIIVWVGTGGVLIYIGISMYINLLKIEKIFLKIKNSYGEYSLEQIE